VAMAGPYLSSAHGNSSYGVNRTDTAGFGYAIGNCAHCHEQHASIGGSEPNPIGGPTKFCLLADNFSGVTSKPYSQSDNVCFYCHVDTVTGTLQNPAFNNFSYSVTFGGYTAPASYSIFEAFNSTSYHNLNDVLNFAKSTWSSTFTANSNPCSACHNVHIAKKSCGKPSGSFDSTKSAISKPSDHGNLWGDEEKMSNYTGGYQAPYYNSTITYEPDGSATSDPSKLPDYVTFCTDCHNSTNSIYSTVIWTLFNRNLYTIDWANEMHGGYVATYCSLSGASLLAAPYDGLTKCGQYVLACTDCHEPHGSPNNFLVRKQVNNGIVIVTQYGDGNSPEGGDRFGKEWVWLCRSCHTHLYSDSFHTHPATLPSQYTPSYYDKDGNPVFCDYCHSGPLGIYRNCQECHFHGNRKISGIDYGKPLF
jgi:hypothetical protein